MFILNHIFICNSNITFLGIFCQRCSLAKQEDFNFKSKLFALFYKKEIITEVNQRFQLGHNVCDLNLKLTFMGKKIMVSSELQFLY